MSAASEVHSTAFVFSDGYFITVEESGEYLPHSSSYIIYWSSLLTGDPNLFTAMCVPYKGAMRLISTQKLLLGKTRSERRSHIFLHLLH